MVRPTTSLWLQQRELNRSKIVPKFQENTEIFINLCNHTSTETRYYINTKEFLQKPDFYRRSNMQLSSAKVHEFGSSLWTPLSKQSTAISPRAGELGRHDFSGWPSTAGDSWPHVASFNGFRAVYSHSAEARNDILAIGEQSRGKLLKRLW